MTRSQDARAAVLTVALIAAFAGEITAQTTKNVLVLHNYGPSIPARRLMDRGLTRVFEAEAPGFLQVHVEALERYRFPADPQMSVTRDYLREKYRAQPIDVVIAMTDTSLAFVRQYPDLFPGARIIAVLSLRPDAEDQQFAAGGVWARFGVRETVETHLGTHPATDTVFVIEGALGNDGRIEKEIRAELAGMDGVSLVYLRDLPLDEVVERVRAASPRSMGIYVRQLIGADGQPGDHLAGLGAILDKATIPIYGVTDQQLGRGVVGGFLVNTEGLGADAARLAVYVLKYGAQPPLPWVQAQAVPMFDGRELRRWSIAEAQLPHGSIIQNRDLPVWTQYKRYVVATLALLLLQTLLILGLLAQRAKVRQSEQSLRESEAALRTSRDRIQDLAGRLITAQEIERTRIARDLHDDISQEIAALTIGLRSVERQLRGKSHALRDSLGSLHERSRELGAAIRSLSHDLHPGVLRHAGLAAALRGYCVEFEKQHGIDTTLVFGGDVGRVDADAALCLYRVAQEALRNVSRHAAAPHVEVRLDRTDDAIELTVADDGRGFDPHRAGGGVGLLSIDERVRLLKGSVTLDSRPQHGTTLSVRVPVGADAPAAPPAN